MCLATFSRLSVLNKHLKSIFHQQQQKDTANSSFNFVMKIESSSESYFMY